MNCILLLTKFDTLLCDLFSESNSKVFHFQSLIQTPDTSCDHPTPSNKAYYRSSTKSSVTPISSHSTISPNSKMLPVRQQISSLSIQTTTPIDFLVNPKQSNNSNNNIINNNSNNSKQKKSLLLSVKRYSCFDSLSNNCCKMNNKTHNQQHKVNDAVIESDDDSESLTSGEPSNEVKAISVDVKCIDQHPIYGYASDSSLSPTSRSNDIITVDQLAHQIVKKPSSDTGPTKNFSLAYSVASHLQNLAMIEDLPNKKRESPMKLANFILDLMTKIDQKMYDKEVDGPNTNEATDLSITILLGAVIFLERLPSGTLTKRNLYHAVAVSMGLSLKIIFDIHPTNARIARMSNICSLERYNCVESRICILVKFNFSLNDDLLIQTRERFSRQVSP